MDQHQQLPSVQVLDQLWMRRSRMSLQTLSRMRSRKQSMTCQCWRELFKHLHLSTQMSWWKKHIDITRSSEHRREKAHRLLLHLLHRQWVHQSQDWLPLILLWSRPSNNRLDLWTNSKWRGQTSFIALSWEVKDRRHRTLLQWMSNLRTLFFTEDYLNTTMDCPTTTTTTTTTESIRESWWHLMDTTFPHLLLHQTDVLLEYPRSLLESCTLHPHRLLHPTLLLITQWKEEFFQWLSRLKLLGDLLLTCRLLLQD